MRTFSLLNKGRPLRTVTTPRLVAIQECELTRYRRTEFELREALSREEGHLRAIDALIVKERELSKESDHRLLNNVQMLVSLLSLQSRRTTNAEAASQLQIAANRLSTIGRVHRCLHSCDGLEMVAFKHYVEDLCREFSLLLSPVENPDRQIEVVGCDLNLPASTAIPLGFIVNELITNAAKYGHGRIAVRLSSNGDRGRAVSVLNEGPALPEGFDPASGKGLGMTIIRSFIDRIDGKLQVGRGDNETGACFTVLIP